MVKRFWNLQLMYNIHQVEKIIWLHWNGVKRRTNEVGTLEGCGDIYMCCGVIFIIFYLEILIDKLPAAIEKNVFTVTR